MSETPTVPPFVNKAMKFVLSSPAHGMVSKSVLLLTFTGRKSGQPYTTPVSYSQTGDRVTIFTHAQWWKNLRGGAPVTLRLRGRELQGLADPIAEDKQAVAAALGEHLKRVPGDARYYGVTFDETGCPRQAGLAEAALSVVMVSIQLC
jgi:deazaflavin-dependent oxidoreductase (nitroreductase family)